MQIPVPVIEKKSRVRPILKVCQGYTNIRFFFFLGSVATASWGNCEVA